MKQLIDAAQGRRDCDLIIENVRYIDVFSCTWREGCVSVCNGRIVGVESGLKAKRIVDGRGKWLVPGFIDAHVHVESSMMLPHVFEGAVLSRGTTTAVCDPHEIANVLGVEGIKYFLRSSESLAMDLWVMLSSCVPATHLETNGGGTISASDLALLKNHPRALGLAEMMNFPGVIGVGADVLAKLAAFEDRPRDGHCPGLTGSALSAYACAGITSCHESTEPREASEKLSKGISVWIREGSVAKDLDTLAPLLRVETSTSIGFCTDDRNPYDIAEQGHLDYLIRKAIRTGVDPLLAYRGASWSVARHYGLDRSVKRVGAIAPGYMADLVMLDDAGTCAVSSVWKAGVQCDEISSVSRVSLSSENSVKAVIPDSRDLIGPTGRVRVIGVITGKIVTRAEVADSNDPTIATLAVLERYGHGQKPAVGYVRGFGAELSGAIASSVGHDSHNLIVVGKNPSDMAAALKSLVECGGGFSVVKDGVVLASVALPFGGLMSDKSPSELHKEISKLREAGRAIGCVLEEPFLQLAFLSLPVIPELKLTDRGLVDVGRFDFVPVLV